MFLKSFFAQAFVSTALASANVPVADVQASQRCIMYGDSIANALGAEGRRMGFNTVSAAIDGVGILNGTKEQLRRMTVDNLNLIRQGDKVFISLGTNDFWRVMNNEQKEENFWLSFKARIRDIQLKGGQVSGIIGVGALDYAGFTRAQERYLNTTFSNKMQAVAMEMNIPYIPTTDLKKGDGVHPDRDSNQILMNRIQNAAGPCL